MSDAFMGIVLCLLSLGGGYFISWYIGRKTIAVAKKIIEQADDISLTDEFHLTHILASNIRGERFLPDLIVAITPGGNMIAEWLSRRFLGDGKKPIPVCTVWVDVKRDKKRAHTSAPAVCNFLSPSPALLEGKFEGKKILIVNDITRTGQTLAAAVKFVDSMLGNATIKTAVLFFCKDAHWSQPDFWVYQPKRYVVFEWKEKRFYTKSAEQEE